MPFCIAVRNLAIRLQMADLFDSRSTCFGKGQRLFCHNNNFVQSGLSEILSIIAFNKLSQFLCVVAARADPVSVSTCLYSSVSERRSRWDVTDAGDVLGAGRSWQTVVPLPLCRV